VALSDEEGEEARCPVVWLRESPDDERLRDDDDKELLLPLLLLPPLLSMEVMKKSFGVQS